MPTLVPLINGRAYDYACITLAIMGIPISGITAINYGEKQAKSNNYGAGNLPVSRGYGPVEFSGSLELSMNEVEAIRAAAPGRKLRNIAPFDIVVVFENNQAVTTHTIKKAEFMDDGLDSKQGDTDIKKSYELIIADISY